MCFYRCGDQVKKMVIQNFRKEIYESFGNIVRKSVKCSWEVKDEDLSQFIGFDRI